jgi:actin-like ATPase involved in cell morphogenesis
VQYLKNERNLLINRLSAEHYILRATSIYGEGESKIIPIKGLNLLTESPGIINLAKVDMENALYPILDGIITTISKQITYTFIGSDSIEKLVVLERNLAPVLLWSDRLASQLGSSYKIMLKAAE